MPIMYSSLNLSSRLCRRSLHPNQFRRRNGNFLLIQILFVASLTTLTAAAAAAAIANDASDGVVETLSGGTQRWEQRDQYQPHRQGTLVFPTTAFTNDFRSDHLKADKRRKRRWFGVDYKKDGVSENNDSNHYWKEMRKESTRDNFYDDLDNGIQETHCKKKRMDFIHFGRIEQKSIFEGMQGNHHNNNNDDDENEDEDHPLRTPIWKINVNWSLFSPKSSALFRQSVGKHGRSLEMELHPEGYCRMVEGTSSASNRSVLGIGRWKKRPWGVTVVVRPLLVLESCTATTTSEITNDATRRLDGESTLMENKNLLIVDEDTEFIFHAKGFHWNGFGSNPKLTQGTILLQKQNKKDYCFTWWKSTTSAYSSILPLWPEEVSGEEADDGIVTNANDLGSTYTNVIKPANILNTIRKAKRNGVNTGNRRRWFRPVVGTFTATGLMP
mmetsp:Transcript_18978/g.52937  ORF Transcript_18978/g.52937 Transcript_18978/m.52937 type:complete len:442 (-) Transcript_18978:102-1427(-)|eukprot:CAMPEP_0172368498 /NCGR_PEP_ID=MMETSP1060-20121228/27550_1 /TAXON_ID=37318 /ORGANISM="Pseudo-nitzschia pungens, Strain cf. cingulata" /LENGTH=441 /DNA_ID=CAMNT_0013093105 /DNA_START=163 /DNA_END=1488 /DNA_ORIENTATION=+